MQIRGATLSDVPGIIAVLRASLGESILPKSEEIWKYKHINNPFGKSIVLLAIVEGKIVGVRAFMRWEWQIEEEIFSGLRAVDTATHPDYRGKGIFKTLTLKAVEIAKEKGDHLIFNTPNSQSLPGYLKMGWQEVNKLSIQLIPVNPMYWKKGINLQYKIEKIASRSHLENLTYNYNEILKGTNTLFTPKSDAYLNWRYENNPLQKYQVKAEEDFYVAAYLKKHKYFSELRITEAIYKDLSSQNKLKKEIYKWAKDFGVQVISISNIPSNNIITFALKGNYGPMLTLRDLNLNKITHNKLQNLKIWNYSLGDLELF